MKPFPKVDSAILEWVEKNRLVNSRGEPFEFDMHSFLLEPLSDWSRKIAIRKSAQIGFSESFGILKALFGAFYYKWNIIYTNPTVSSSDTFVSTKVNPIIDANEVLGGSVYTHKMEFKQIGNRFVYFRGTHSSETADKKADSDKGISITSDLNIYDERDRSDQFIIDQYASRLENSDYGGEWSFSNPTYPGIGVDKLWEESDQKHWTVKCPHCGHFQYMDWVKQGEEDVGILEHCLVDAVEKCFICGKCRGLIDDTTRMRGRWVAKYPEREISGYWMSQLNYPKHSAHSILDKEASRSKDNFYNFVLGKPYKGTDVTVDRKVIFNNIIRTTNDRQKVAMGVDQGIKKHYVLMNETGIFEIGVTEDWKEIEYLLKKYNATAVMDAMPYPTPVKELVDRYNRGKGPRVYMAYYKEPKDKSQPTEWLKGKRSSEVYIHRTMMFDILVDKFASKQMPINMPDKDLVEFTAAWGTMFRAQKPDSLGIMRPNWDSANKSIDHFAHATLYANVAMEKVTGIGSMTGGFAKNRGEVGNSIEIDDNWTSALPSLDELVNNQENTKKSWPYF